MIKAKKPLCIKCKTNSANYGREVCLSCHGKRLAGDVRKIIETIDKENNLRGNGE